MKYVTIFAYASLMLIPASIAQTPSGPGEETRLTHDGSTGTFTFSWWGRAGRTYVIQHSDDLMQWHYVPIIEVGSDQLIQWGFTSTAHKMFLRLKYTASPPGDPLHVDIDGNGLPDDWELLHFGALDQNPSADSDSDGRSHLTEYLAGTDPTIPNGEVGPAFIATGLKVFTQLE